VEGSLVLPKSQRDSCVLGFHAEIAKYRCSQTVAVGVARAGEKCRQNGRNPIGITTKTRIRRVWGSGNAENLHHFIAEVVDDFDGDAAGFGLGEGAAGVAVETVAGFFVDFGFEGGF